MICDALLPGMSAYGKATRIRVESLEARATALANRVAGPIQNWINSTDPRIGKVEVRVGEVEVNATSAIRRLGIAEPRVSGLENRTLIVEGDVTGIKASVTALLARLKEPNDTCSIVAIKNRLDTAEGKANRFEITLKAIVHRVNAMDPLRAKLAQVEAENVLLKGRVQELETQKLASDQKIEKMQQDIDKLWERARETVVALHQADRIFSNKVKENTSQISDVNHRFKDASKKTEVRLEELSEQIQKQREELTDMRILLSKASMQSRRASREFSLMTVKNGMNSEPNSVG
jgi:chromosome segregation ATPase